MGRRHLQIVTAHRLPKEVVTVLRKQTAIDILLRKVTTIEEAQVQAIVTVIPPETVTMTEESRTKAPATTTIIAVLVMVTQHLATVVLPQIEMGTAHRGAAVLAMVVAAILVAKAMMEVSAILPVIRLETKALTAVTNCDNFTVENNVDIF